MARTTPNAVQTLLDVDYKRGRDLAPFIDTASSFIDDVVTCAAAKEPPVTLTAAKLELLERWMAGHCYKMSDQAYATKSIGRASGSFQGQTAMNFDATKYGQTAMSLDPSGCLRQMSAGHGASVHWLGKNPVDQTDYVDRGGS